MNIGKSLRSKGFTLIEKCRLNFSRGSWVRDYITATEYLIERGHTGHGGLGSEVPFYDAMVAEGAIDIFQTSVDDNGDEGYYIYGFGDLPLTILLHHPAIAEGKHSKN